MKVKEVAMVIALAILGALFVGLFVDAVYEKPEYEDFCGKGSFEGKYYGPYPERANLNCTYQMTKDDRMNIDKCNEDGGSPEFNYDDNYCQTSFKECNYCQKEYNEANKIYNRNVFFIVVPIGVIAILAGLFLSFEVVGSGLMFSGILLVAYGTIRYFSNMSKIFRVVVIFIELVLLIFISIKKLKK